MKIACSGQVNESTGIGVVQTHLYAYLASKGHELVFSKPRDVGGGSTVAKARGLARGFRPAPAPNDAYLSVVPPLPIGVRSPLLTVVHDLRWMRTRSSYGRAYRAWDLRRTVELSESLLCISNHTQMDLIEFDARAADRSIVSWLGPGQVPSGAFSESCSGLVMLVGRAAHKRNELAAHALASFRPSWVRGVIGVGVSDVVRTVLSAEFRCEWFDGLTDAQMLEQYQRAEVFVMLGTDEGFGLPFVEALASGCQVVATDHLLAREILGGAGYFISGADVDVVGRQLATKPSVPHDARKRQLQNFSWQSFGRTCESELLRIAAGDRK